MRVLGVDACRDGWVGIAWGGGEQLWPYVGATVADVLADCVADGPVAVTGVDIPIGLPDSSAREADLAARQAVGPRRSSVFETPVRAALLAPDQHTAGQLNQAATGRKVSIQAFRLRHRILEVDAWLREAAQTTDRPTVYEVHPEVSFALMAGSGRLSTLDSSKRTWAGVEQRRMLLAREGLFLAGRLGQAGAHAGVDDILDAAAVAWTAARLAAGDARSIPDPPQVFSDGVPAAIWV